MELHTRLERFLGELPLTALAETASRKAGRPVPEVMEIFETFANETRATLRLVVDDLKPEQRILEVGAGLCLFSSFLKQEGYDVVALEPALGGYGLFEAAREAVSSHFSGLGLPVLDCPAEALNAAEHGHFNLIFSNNVIEHIPEWQKALAAITSVLAPGGRMRHTCPNYTVPYEPHYGVPVFRYCPRLSRRLFASRINANPGIWDSLNFLTSRQLLRQAEKIGLAIEFERGTLYSSLKRLDTDPEFRARHQGIVLTIYKLLKVTGLLALIRHMPVSLTTPMTFTATKKEQA